MDEPQKPDEELIAKLEMIELNKIYNEDALEMLTRMETGSVGYFIFSPPYNMGNTTGCGMKQYQGHYNTAGGMTARGGRGKWKGAALVNGYGSFADNMPHDEYVVWQKAVLTECWRLLDSRGAIFYNHKPRILGGICVTPLDYNPDLPVRQIIIWKRAGGINFNIRFYLPTHEWIVVFGKPGFQLQNKSVSQMGDVWEFSQEMNNPHPAPFPVELPLRILHTIPNFAKPVCDPFSGSGSTRIAAHKAGFNFVGSEINQDYVDLANKRLEPYLAQESLF